MIVGCNQAWENGICPWSVWIRGTCIIMTSQSLKKKKRRFSLKLCVCVCVWLYDHECRYLQRPEEGVTPPTPTPTRELEL